MKNWALPLLSLLIFAFVLSACKKDKTGKDDKSDGKTGNIKVSIQYESPSGAASVWTWNSTKVELLKDWEVIATLYTDPSNPTVDFGDYEYGATYSVMTSAKVTRINASSGQTFNNDAWSEMINFELNQPTMILNNYVKVHY